MAPGFRLLICAALLCCAACSPNLTFAPPPQKIVPQGPELPLTRALVRMSDPDVDAFLVQDVAHGDIGSAFRWTGEHPRIKLFPDDVNDRELYLRFGIIPSTFKATGPVTIGITINGTKLADATFDAAGDYDYARAVPERLLAASPVIVQLDISPVYVAPPYGEKLGITLQIIGIRKMRRP